MQSKWSSSSSTYVKLKTLFLNLITVIAKRKTLIKDIPQKKKLITYSLCRLLRSFSRAKSIIKDISKLNKKRLFMMMSHPTTNSSINHCNVFVGSSIVIEPFSLHGHDEDEENHDQIDVGDEDDIDRLADKFIAKCHEKVESYRRFEEMLARG
ncbi:hypothetical protein CARUB_v10025212mg [Capsella rubella]|uniref:Cotton fiber protein n=1 Tax=Capsella rubella TaxID=81985 RepID=R0HU82_9BRAS|nr:hypothetical protein CARUB_v10025212mg [Capsella rubella]